jgi:phosphatidylserine/phosphatidylglycerophosphate/cardiolipin synthase-like enzyme
MYGYDRPAVATALVAAHTRGVPIRIVGESDVYATQSTYGGPYPALESVLGPGHLVLDDRSSLQHNKFAVFDKKIVWTGSANFTDRGFDGSAENAVVINNEGLADFYTSEFEQMFEGAFSNAKLPVDTWRVPVGDAEVEALFLPRDDAAAKLQEALAGAEESIYVSMFSFTHWSLAQALIDLPRSVDVKVILDGQLGDGEGSQVNRLCDAGIAVRTALRGSLVHNKYAVVDPNSLSVRPLVVTGSANWSENGMTANDENVLLIADEATVRAYALDFDLLWDDIGHLSDGCPDRGTALYLPLALRNSAPEPAPADLPDVMIVRIDYDPPGNEVDWEYVRLKNVTSHDRCLYGWSLSDSDNHVYHFGHTVVPQLQSVILWTKTGETDSRQLFWGHGTAIWNNDGDTATLTDSRGLVVDEYSYP